MAKMTDEQKAVLHRAIGDVADGHKDIRIGGAAGTGKTSILGALVKRLQRTGRMVYVCAPTNKAAKILRDKIGSGVPISTLHKLLDARPVELHEEQREGLANRIMNLMQAGKDKEADKAQRELAKLEKESLSFETGDAQLGDKDIVIVDESSMVGAEMRDALLNFGVTAIFVGDPFQLPPVNSAPWFSVPDDMTLQTVHRQTDGSAILELATAIRKCGWLVKGEKKMKKLLEGLSRDFKDAPDIVFLEKSDVNNYAAMRSIALDHDQVLTFHRNDSDNKVRPFKVRSLNQALRQLRGVRSPLPTAGERLILSSPFTSDDGSTGDWFAGEMLTLASDARMINNGVIGNKARFKDGDWLYPAKEAARAAGAFVADVEHEGGETLRNVAISPGLYDCRPLTMMLSTIANRRADRLKVSEIVPLTRLMDAEFSAAITTHLSQGSEWESVAVFVPAYSLDWQDDGGRSWLYTAVTRARAKLTIVVI